MRRAGIHGDLALPLAGQRNAGLVAQHEAQIFALAHESAIGLGLEHANCDHVASRLQYAIADGINARVLNPGTGTDLLTVDKRGVHALDDAQVQHGAAGGKRIGQHDLLAKPCQCRCVGHAQFGEAAGNLDRLPGGVVQFQSSPVALCTNVELVVPVHYEVAVFGRARGGQPCQLRQRHIEILHRTQGFGACPGLSRRSAYVIQKQTDRHVNILLNPARKIVRDCGDPVRRLWCYLAPLASD